MLSIVAGLEGHDLDGLRRRFKAEPPEGLEPGSPFGPNLRAFVIYLRSVQNIPLARLSDVLRDLLGLEISEGALVNILRASREPFAKQTSLLKCGCSRERRWPRTRPASASARPTGGCGCSTIGDTAVFVADAHRSKRSWRLSGRMAAGLLDFGSPRQPEGLGDEGAAILPLPPHPRRAIRHRRGRRGARAGPEGPAEAGLRHRTPTRTLSPTARSKSTRPISIDGSTAY